MRTLRDNNLRLRNFARQLRKTQTDAESKLWSILRSRQLSGYKFRRQYPLLGFILDFYCVREKFAVELDGGQHGEPAVETYDLERTRRLSEFGVRLVRYWDHEILRTPDVVAEDIYNRLREPSPQPSPGVPGEGVSGVATRLPSPGVPGEGVSGMATSLPSPGAPGEGERA